MQTDSLGNREAKARANTSTTCSSQPWLDYDKMREYKALHNYTMSPSPHYFNGFSWQCEIVGPPPGNTGLSDPYLSLTFKHESSVITISLLPLLRTGLVLWPVLNNMTTIPTSYTIRSTGNGFDVIHSNVFCS